MRDSDSKQRQKLSANDLLKKPKRKDFESRPKKQKKSVYVSRRNKLKENDKQLKLKLKGLDKKLRLRN